MGLTIVDIMIDEMQALDGSDKTESSDFVCKEPLVFTRIRAGVVHQYLEAHTARVSDSINAQLAVPLLTARIFSFGCNQSILLQLRQQRVEPSIAKACIWPDYVIDNLCDEIPMRSSVHQL